MTLNDLVDRTVVALGLEEKPQHSIAVFPCRDRESKKYSFFITFNHLEDDRYDFGEEIPLRGPEDEDPDDLIAAVFFAGERDWNNFVKLINSSDAKIQAHIKETREKENEK